MAFLRTNRPPQYDPAKDRRQNFEEFFGWGMSLRQGMGQLLQIAEDVDLPARRHPLGFWVVYLGGGGPGTIKSPGCTGIVRANFYPPGEELRDDIHNHGFDLDSGCIDGELHNIRHFPDFSPEAQLPDGEGLVGYMSSPDVLGVNHTMRVMSAVIPEPRSELQVLGPWDTYSMEREVDFHSIAAAGKGALTIFAKTPYAVAQDGASLMLKRPQDPPPPAQY